MRERELPLNEMSADECVKRLIAGTKWSDLQSASGTAEGVTAALQSMIFAATAEDVESVYWQLENVVVVSGGVYESAVAVVPVILAALMDANRPSFIRIGLLELLFQIVHSETRFDANTVGVHIRCRDAARSGLWLLYREMVYGITQAAREIIEVLEDNELRRELFLK